MKINDTYHLCAHMSKLGSDQACYDYLVQVRWNGRPQCPHCNNSNMNYFLSTRKIYKCSSCRKQFSATKGTIFEKSKVPLSKWFLAIYLFTTKKRGLSSIQMSKWLGVKQHTAWFMLHRLREAMKNENEIILHGIVEADEVFIGPLIQRDTRLIAAKIKHDQEQERIHGLNEALARKRRGYAAKTGRKKGSTKDVLAQKKIDIQNKGERIPFERPTVIFGMMEKGGRVIMKKIGDRGSCANKATIQPLLKKYIKPGSVLMTDESKVYNNIDFFTHLTVNHSKIYVTTDGVHTNNIENAWKHFEKLIEGTYFHMSYHHYDRYLDENTYRYNRRNDSELKLFEDFIPLLFETRVSYKNLIFNEDRLAA